MLSTITEEGGVGLGISRACRPAVPMVVALSTLVLVSARTIRTSAALELEAIAQWGIIPTSRGLLQDPIDIRLRARRGNSRCGDMYWIRSRCPLEVGPGSQELTDDLMGWLQCLVASEVTAQRLNIVRHGGDLAQG